MDFEDESSFDPPPPKRRKKAAPQPTIDFSPTSSPVADGDEIAEFQVPSRGGRRSRRSPRNSTEGSSKIQKEGSSTVTRQQTSSDGEDMNGSEQEKLKRSEAVDESLSGRESDDEMSSVVESTRLSTEGGDETSGPEEQEWENVGDTKDDDNR